MQFTLHNLDLFLLSYLFIKNFVTASQFAMNNAHIMIYTEF